MRFAGELWECKGCGEQYVSPTAILGRGHYCSEGVTGKWSSFRFVGTLRKSERGKVFLQRGKETPVLWRNGTD